MERCQTCRFVAHKPKGDAPEPEAPKSRKGWFGWTIEPDWFEWDAHISDLLRWHALNRERWVCHRFPKSHEVNAAHTCGEHRERTADAA